MHKKDKKRQKTRFTCNFNGKSSLSLFFYYARQRHNPRSDFFKNGLKSNARLKKKKITTNVGGVPFRVKTVNLETIDIGLLSLLVPSLLGPFRIIIMLFT